MVGSGPAIVGEVDAGDIGHCSPRPRSPLLHWVQRLDWSQSAIMGASLPLQVASQGPLLQLTKAPSQAA